MITKIFVWPLAMFVMSEVNNVIHWVADIIILTILYLNVIICTFILNIWICFNYLYTWF